MRVEKEQRRSRGAQSDKGRNQDVETSKIKEAPMTSFNRRSFVGLVAAAPIATAVPERTALAVDAAPASPAPAGTGERVTAKLAAYIVKAKHADLPPRTRREGLRTFLN
jgi:hypothetical protein